MHLTKQIVCKIGGFGMRSIGLIKWYNAWSANSRIGIECADGSVVYVYEKDIVFDYSPACHTKIVTFELLCEKRPINIKEFSDDNLYFEQINEMSSSEIYDRYLKDIKFLQDKNIDINLYINCLPDEILKKYRKLRDFLTLDKHIKICLEILINGDDDIKEELLELIRKD